MATVSRFRRSLSGLALIVAGALVLAVFVLPLAGITIDNLGVLALVILAAALLILALVGVTHVAAMIVLFASALGLVVYAVSQLGVPLPGGVMTLALFVGIFGFLAGALVLFFTKEIGGRSGIALIIAAVFVFVWLFLATGGLNHVAAVAAGAFLIVAGIFFVRGSRAVRP